MSKRKQIAAAARTTETPAEAAPARTFTAVRHFRTRMKEPIVGAFLHVERLEQPRERKLTAAAWDAALATFAATPR